MTEAWRQWGVVVTVAIAGLPLAAAVIALLARRRIAIAARPAGQPALAVRRRAWRYSIAEVGLIAGTLPWLWMVFTPRPGPGRVDLVPVREIAAQLTGDPVVAVVQLGGNLLVFAALGFFGPMRWPALRAGRARLALGAALSIGIESLQYLLDLGRVSAVDDVLVNAVGALLAGYLSRRWWARPTSVGMGTPEVPAAH